jgi:hypothetical protein
MDPQGRIKSQRRPDGTLVASSCRSQDLWWSNPKPGESRDVSFTETFERAGARAASAVRRLQPRGPAAPIETPAGEFEVMPIESSGWTSRGKTGQRRRAAGQFTRTVWYSPKLGHPVRIDIRTPTAWASCCVRERVELMHAQRAPLP